MEDSSEIFMKRYRRSVRASFFLVLFLVLVGGIVRSTGAGMGCPDWPKCFGYWVPPTDASQVPASYYQDPLSSKDGQLIFNPVKTWTEYINRLIGVVIGISIFVQMVLAFRSKSPNTARFFSVLAFLLVLFEGWLGAKVVSSDLRPLVITIHLIGAILIALSLLVSLHHALPAPRFKLQKVSLPWIGLILGALIVQFFLGTKVRGQVDLLFKEFEYGSRELYVGRLDVFFLIHRSFSILVLGLLIFQVFQLGRRFSISDFGYILIPLFCAFGLVLSGVMLNYFDFPAAAQPFHLSLGFALICSQFWLLLKGLSQNQFTYAGSGKSG